MSIAAALIVAGILDFPAALSAVVVLNADDPGVPLLLFLVLVAGAALGLVVVVLRALLRQAADLRADMEAVI